MVQWEVTGSCNHNCIHCYNYWREEAPSQRLVDGYEAVCRTIVDELLRHRVFSVTITGGEPLLVIEQVAPFIKMLADSGVHLTMNSNLTLLDQTKMELIQAIGIRSILVSVPSGNSETCDRITDVKGSLDRTVRGIRLAKDSGMRLFTNMVVSRINQHQVRETAELIASLGLDHFAATRAADPSSNRGFTPWQLDLVEFRQMQTELEKVGKEFGLRINSLEANPVCSYGGVEPAQGYKFCSAGKTTCTIGFDGAVRPCNRTDMVYGNAVEDGLIKPWLKMEDWRSGAWIPEECSDCKLKIVCGGGCKVDATTAHGSPKAVDPLCDPSAKSIPLKHDRPELPQKAEFEVNPRLQFRLEAFGSILFTTPKTWVPVGPELTDLLKNGKEVVTIEQIGHALSVSLAEARQTAGVLMQKQVLL